MSRYLVGALVALVAVGAGCAARSASERPAPAARYELIHPPDVKDEHYPGGVHLRSDAPTDTWHRVAVFATSEECEKARIARIDDSIDAARAEVGERAKFALPVRRAVNARCVAVR